MKLPILFLIFTLLTLSTSAWCQTIPEDSAEFQKYRNYLSNSRHQDAMRELQRISQENPGTQLDGLAQLQLAILLDEFAQQESAREKLEGIAASFAGSRVGYLAKANLIDFDFIVAEPQRWEEETDKLLAELGTPSLERISNGNAPQAVVLPTSLQDEEHGRLVYDILSTAAELKSGTGDSISALNIFSYLQMNYANEGFVNEIDLALSIKREAGDIFNPGEPISGENDLSPPVISLLSPNNGDSVTSPVSVMFRVHDTSLIQSQPDPSTANLAIDEISVKGLLVKTSVSNTLSFEISKTMELSAGQHTGIFSIKDIAGNEATVTFDFIVAEDIGQIKMETTKDSTLRAHKPHRNEGANPRLFLSHRLEARNKSQNPLVGFDLSEAELNGLSKATLVMNIQDCELPRRWGKNGRFIEAHALTASWIEGNGNKYRVSGNNGKTKGEGQGVTWFSPADGQIRNNRPDGSQQWMGGRSITAPLTAPAIQVLNRQTGPIEFDVTQDVLQAASLSSSPEISWLLKKQDESKFGNIRFYSKEGAAQAGDETLAPTLILEYGSQMAQSPVSSNWLTALGIGSTVQFEISAGQPELPSFRKQLQDSPVAGVIGETLMSRALGSNPMMGLAAQTAYRAWIG